MRDSLTLTGLLFVALCGVSTATADVVGPGPERCPSGSLPMATHERAWCAPPRRCRTIRDCAAKIGRDKGELRWDPSDPNEMLASGAHECVEVDLCVRRVSVPAELGPYEIEEATSTCDAADPCEGADHCDTRLRCVTADPAPEPPADSFGCAATPSHPVRALGPAPFLLIAAARRWPRK